MTNAPHRERIEIGFSAVILLATFYVAPALGMDLPTEATGVAILAAMTLFGDGAGDILREFTATTEIESDMD